MDKIFKLLQKQQVTSTELEDHFLKLNEHDKLKEENKRGQGLLHLAIATNSEDLVEVVLNQKGIDVNRSDTDSHWPSLIYAIATYGNKDIVKLLLSYRADVNLVDDNLGFTAVHWAAKMDNLEVLQLLCARSSALLDKPSVQTEDTPLHVACSNRAETAAEFLISKGADLNAQNMKGETPVHVAVRQQLPNLVLKMMDTNNVSVDDAVDVLGNTPLHLSREQDLHALSKLLQSRGFSFTKKNKAGLTPDDIMTHLSEREKREHELKTAAREDKEGRKHKEKEQHMKSSEVTKFCELYHLQDLSPMFYTKKILFVDEYFLQLDEGRLKKMSCTPEQRSRFFAAIQKRQDDIEEKARQAEREAMHQEMMRRRWKQFFGIVGIAFVFALIFVFLKFLEYQTGPKKLYRREEF